MTKHVLIKEEDPKFQPLTLVINSPEAMRVLLSWIGGSGFQEYSHVLINTDEDVVREVRKNFEAIYDTYESSFEYRGTLDVNANK